MIKLHRKHILVNNVISEGNIGSKLCVALSIWYDHFATWSQIITFSMFLCDIHRYSCNNMYFDLWGLKGLEHMFLLQNLTVFLSVGLCNQTYYPGQSQSAYVLECISDISTSAVSGKRWSNKSLCWNHACMLSLEPPHEMRSP